MKTKICSLAGVVSDSGYASVNSSHIRLVRGTGNTAEIVPVEQISVAIFAQRQHKLRRCSSGYIDDSCANAAQIGVTVIKIEPIARRPVVSSLASPSRSRLQTDNSFAPQPIAARIEGVACDDEHVCTVASNAAMSPNAAASRRCRPAMHIARVIHVHANNPPMIIAAIAHVTRVRRVYDPVHKSEAATLFLRQRNERNSVVNDGGIQVHRPTGSGGTSVHVQRVNEMLRRAAVDQRVEEKPARGEINNWRARDTSGIKTSARRGWDGRTNVSTRPDR